jgi:hypothetical protein
MRTRRNQPRRRPDDEIARFGFYPAAYRCPAAASCPANKITQLLRVVDVLGLVEGGAARWNRVGCDQSRVVRPPDSRPGSERRSPPMDCPRRRARLRETRREGAPSSPSRSPSSGAGTSGGTKIQLNRQSISYGIAEGGEFVTLTSNALKPDEGCESRDCNDIAMLAVRTATARDGSPAPSGEVGRIDRPTQAGRADHKPVLRTVARAPPRRHGASLARE